MEATSIILIALISLSVFCGMNSDHKPKPSTTPPKHSESPQQGESINDIGTVFYYSVEGGCYGIRTDSGKKYRLTPDFNQFPVGTRVKFSGIAVNEISFYMWGTKLYLKNIEMVEPIRNK